MRGSVRLGWVAALLAVAAVVAAGCGGDDDSGSGDGDGKGTTINVAIVDNPQMKDIAKLTPCLFTAKSDIKVNYTVLDEGTLRQVTTRDVAAGGKQFDVTMIGMYEAPQFGQNGSLVDLTPLAGKDPAYQLDDIIPSVRKGLSVDDKLYAAPFYGESSFVMYRKDLLKKAGVEMPAQPTWQQIADIARKIDPPETAGICLRGKPGWATWAASRRCSTRSAARGGRRTRTAPMGEAQIGRPRSRQALQFYVGLVTDAAEDAAANAELRRCLVAVQDGKVAMWYDATVAAGLLEADDSDAEGQDRLRAGPVKRPTRRAGCGPGRWPSRRPRKIRRGMEYVAFATGPGYLTAGRRQIAGGWAAIPPGTRRSTYATPEYQKAAEAFAEPTLEGDGHGAHRQPRHQPRPGLPGVQFVGVPEFQDVGNQCTEEFSGGDRRPDVESMRPCSNCQAHRRRWVAAEVGSIATATP